MPGGLKDVEQRFSAETSGYIDGLRRMIEQNRQLIDSVRDVVRQTEEIKRVTGDDSGWRRMAVGLDETSQAIRRYNAMVDEAHTANAKFNESQVQTERLSRDARQALFNLADAHGMVGERVTRSQAEIAKAHVEQMSLLDQMVVKLGAAKDAYAKLPEVSKPLQYTTADVERLTNALSVAEKRANSFATAFYGEGGASRAGDAMRGIGAGAYGPIPPRGAIYAGGGDGGGGGAAAVIAALRPSNIFGGALPTLQAVHMITMATMEVLSTAIPAAVAGAAAAAVANQGRENLQLRAQGMYTAAEALGGAYGTSFGPMAGMGGGFQAAQNQATGGVYGIAGGLMQMARQGTGAGGILGPGGMGVQTVAMIDRGIAAMVLNNRMGQVTSAMAGGTGFLRSFGDIGANIGDTLLNLAPNLPGIGPMWLGGLKGLTGAAAWTTGHIPGPLMGAGLAAEAGYRWGGLALSGGKLPGWLGGGKLGGLAGMAERMGLGTVADAGAGVGATGLAGFLDAAGGPGTLGLALAAFAMSQLAGTMPTGPMRQIAGLQGGIGQAFGADAWTPVTKALYQARQMGTGLPGTGFAGYVAQYMPAMETSSQYTRFGPASGMGPSAAGVVQNALGSFSQQMGNLIAEGPAVQKALASIGDKGASLSDAFAAATMAMIPLSDMVGGKLNPQGQQMLKQWQQAYSTLTTGGTGAPALIQAGAANYIMSTPQMKSLSAINQSMDSMTSIMTGGPYTMTALLGMLGGTPATHVATRAGLQLRAAPAISQFGSALSSFLTPQGQAAWQSVTNPQTGLIATSQAGMDQLRTALTLQALTAQQGTALGAFNVQQMLPLAAHSPAFLAMLQQQGMQANIPGLAMGESYKQTAAAIMRAAASPAVAQKLMTQQVQRLANLPAVAYNLLTGGDGGTSLGQQALTNAASQALAVQQAALAGKPYGGSLQGLVSSLVAGGVKGVPDLQKALTPIMQGTGLTGAKLAGVIHAGTVIYQSEVKPPHAPPAPHGGTVRYPSHVDQPKAPPAPAGGTVVYRSVVIPPGGGGFGSQATLSPTGSLGSLGGRTGGQHGMRVPGFGGGDIFPAMLEPGELVFPKEATGDPRVAAMAGHYRIPGFQHGGIAGGPGWQSELWSLFGGLGQMMTTVNQGLASWAQAGRSWGTFTHYGAGAIGGDGASLLPLPRGRAAGGGIDPRLLQVLMMAEAERQHAAAGYARGHRVPHDQQVMDWTITGHGGQLPLPAYVNRITDKLLSELSKSHGWSDFAVKLMGNFQSSIKNLPAATGGIANALVGKIVQEVQYAKGVSAQTVQGLNLGGMDVTPGTGQGTVQEQMAAYLKSVQAFAGDIGSLRKQGLNKDLTAQMVAAGPVQGDALAQSIMQGPGGVKAANQLYAQIGQAANRLGAQAAMAQYGGVLAPDLKSGTFVSNNVSISVSIPSGKSGDLNLSAGDIKTLVEIIQAKLLQQSRRNQKTGLKAKGKGS